MSARPVCQVLILVTVAAVCPAASAQSLGELARQEEARRKAMTSSGRVYTNDSIRTVQAPAPVQPPAATDTAAGTQPPPAAADAAGSPEAPAPAAASDTVRKDEAYWKKRIVAARDALARSQTFAEALQSRINALSTDFVARDDPAQRAVIAADRQKALAELDRVKQEIQQYTKAIAGIQEEARRAGVPPGWLR